MRVLITGFDPFGGETVNPAFEAVKALPDKINGAQIIKIEVPTVFGTGAEVAKTAIKKYQPDMVIAVGQAGGRASVSFEQVAINLMEARIPDNAGQQPLEQAINPTGPTAYFTTLPIKAMVKACHAAGLPSYISYSAGTFVCNELMYQLLDHFAATNPSVPAGFIHVPFAPAQAVGKGTTIPTMPVETITKTLAIAIEAALTPTDTSAFSTGTTH